jgi:hypothetical protein
VINVFLFYKEGELLVALIKYFDTNSQTYKAAASGAMADGTDQITPSSIKSLNRSSMHSGCINLPIITTGDTTNLNSITIPASNYHINGSFLSMPQTVVTLPAPDATGYREDLVFLEAYFSTTNPYQLTGRYRTVSNVNFNTYVMDGLSTNSITLNGFVNNNASTAPQGGNASPIDTTIANSYNRFCNYTQRGNSANASYCPMISPNDYGVYIAGIGDTTSKTALATYDGYSYAIPLFRVKRRNSSGYSPINPSGARNYLALTPITTVTFSNSMATTIVSNLNGGSNLKDGDIVKYSGSTPYTERVSISGSNVTLTLREAPDQNGTWATNQTYYLLSDRPDNTYANVIDPRDIPQPYDLRHRVQAQFNYDYELKRASDQFMRGEIGTQKKMLKTCHGIPKTVTDGNTVFYASLDGTLTPEVGGSGPMNLGTGSFKPMPTGSGYKFNGDSNTPVAVSGLDASKGSIDLVVNVKDLLQDPAWCRLISIRDASGSEVCAVELAGSTGALACYEYYSDATTAYTNGPVITSNLNYIHVRFTWNATTMSLYINGSLKTSVARKDISVWKVPAKVILGSGSGLYSKSTISDVHISNIDRGATFYHLPTDFISGDAQIMPAMTSQRRILSEAQMTQTVNGIVSVGGATNTTRGITTSRASGSWTSGDTITVTGMAGELVSGVFDTDTALATIVKDQNTGDTTLTVDDVSKLVVNDTFQILDRQLGTLRSTVHTVSAIDTTNKILTITPALTAGISKYQSLIMETTATSSVPAIVFSPSNTAQAGAASTITLASAASATDSYYNGLTIYITSGTGAGQSRTISSYIGATKVATVSSAWTTIPDATSVYKLSRVPVAGTWSGLGTNAVTFTLSAISNNLTTQDIEVDYSIIMPAGQPALMVPTTTTLAGEAGIRIPYANATLAGNDFTGKVSGQTWGNPNIAKTGSVVVISNPVPSTFINELQTSDYANILTQDGTSFSYSTSVNGQQAAVLLSFDIIRIVERKLGSKIPGKDIASKVAWLKNNIRGQSFKLYGYGSSPLGNKAWYSILESSGTTWTSLGSVITSSPTQFKWDGWSDTSLATRVDPNGFAHFLAYADPSDGVTASVINVDYSSLDITFKSSVLGSYKLVNGTLAVRDDFAGKVAGDTVACPNVCKFNNAVNTLLTPNGSWGEISNSSYGQISNLDNTLLSIPSTLVSGNYGQVLFSFNLIREFEDKYGPIPALDKVAWLKANISQINFNWWGYGTSPAGSKATISWWGGSAWSSYLVLQNTGVVSKVTYSRTDLSAYVDANGFVYFIAYADPSDGVTASTVYTDYCNIELTLNSAPTGYDQLVPDNPRRDAGPSQILQVRKETKEVQTLFGSDTPLNLVTYEDYLPQLSTISSSTDVTVVHELSSWEIVDIGSSVGSKWNGHPWANLAYKVNQDSDQLYGEMGVSELGFSKDSINLNTGSLVNLNTGGWTNNYTKQYGLIGISKPLVGIGRWLVVYNSQLYLLIFSKLISNGILNTDNAGQTFLVNISGNPLVKVDNTGIVRSGVVTPTVFKTNELSIQGFLDKASNKIINNLI